VFEIHPKAVIELTEKPEKAKKTRVSVTFTQPFIEGFNDLVKTGFYLDPQDAIRAFTRDGFEKHGIDPFKD